MSNASAHEAARIVAASYPSTGRLARLAAYTATDASAANGWRSTRWAYQIAAPSPDEAYAYWVEVIDEHGDEYARGEIAEALVAVGWTIDQVCSVLS